MPRNKNPIVFYHARYLRRNLTPAEKMLWSRLRNHRLAGVGFRRQHPIGSFIADFCAPRKKLIVELDGGHHAFQKEYDEARTACFHQRGYLVLRFCNSDIMNNIEGVLSEIEKNLLDGCE